MAFPQSGYRTDAYNPFFRPIDVSRVGYSYPAGYRGPQTDWPQYGQPPPPRYTIGSGYPSFAPIQPIQRRTYLVEQRGHAGEPIFMGRGGLVFVGRDAELSCSFYDNRFRIVSVSSCRRWLSN